jgi:hypothetical protein
MFRKPCQLLIDAVSSAIPEKDDEASKLIDTTSCSTIYECQSTKPGKIQRHIHISQAES